MNPLAIIILLVLSLLFIKPYVALAYIGPGAGLSAIGIVIAVTMAILFAIIGFFWYPIKRLLAKIKKNKDKRE
jgi:hypothetical protein